jgi:hypothetical protein
MTMPPIDMAVRGAEAIGRFFTTVPADGRLHEIRLVPVTANRQPALAACMLDSEAGRAPRVRRDGARAGEREDPRHRRLRRPVAVRATGLPEVLGGSELRTAGT